MKVFISWSGSRSLAIARALAELLGDAIQDVEPWMSEHEISAGSRWATELSGALEASSFGVLCLTPENLTAPWLLFEAGCLAKSVSSSRVVPYMLSLRAADVEYPLAQFQGVEASRDGTLKLLSSLNEARREPLPDDRLLRVFDRWWPDLESRLRAVPEQSTEVAPRREDRALLEEILGVLRGNMPRVSQQAIEPAAELLAFMASAAELRALTMRIRISGAIRGFLDHFDQLRARSHSPVLTA